MFRQNGGDGFQKLDAVRAEIADVVVGKALPDVAEGRCAQKGIHNRVKQHICVGVSQKSFLIGNFHAAQDQLPVLHQSVYVISHSYPHVIPLSPGTFARFSFYLFKLAPITFHCSISFSSEQAALAGLVDGSRTAVRPVTGSIYFL